MPQIPIFVQLTAFLALIEFKEEKNNGRRSVLNQAKNARQTRLKSAGKNASTQAP
jgi:hypothetical protein